MEVLGKPETSPQVTTEASIKPAKAEVKRFRGKYIGSAGKLEVSYAPPLRHFDQHHPGSLLGAVIVAIIIPRTTQRLVLKSKVTVELTEKPSVPKYRQIINSIERSLRNGEIKKGDRIPSLNELCKAHGFSQDTVLVAYNELKTRGIITSTVGKGYYVLNDAVGTEHRVFLLFDKLAAYKEILYESLKDTLKGKGTEQIFFHNNNPQVFKTLIEASRGEFSDYVIMPISDDEAIDALNVLDQSRIYMLDQGRSRFADRYPGVYQNFEQDIRDVFAANMDLIDKYRRVVILIRHQRGHYGEIVSGLRRFCRQHSIPLSVENNAAAVEPELGDAFVVVDDRDLITLVKKAAEFRMKLGTDIGVISYNESPLKEVIDGGITTISTDFAQMGRTIAKMVIEGKKEHIDNPFVMIRRSSI
ncbi:MAG: GntR family transcriptional regulator [Bacteroidetes bacterium]|nr:GntR family transcriptional regulator [Bacteroidota bacterium]